MYYHRSKDDFDCHENNYIKIIKDLQEKYEDSIEDKYSLICENEINSKNNENELKKIKKENKELKILNIFISGFYFGLFYFYYYKNNDCLLKIVET